MTSKSKLICEVFVPGYYVFRTFKFWSHKRECVSRNLITGQVNVERITAKPSSFQSAFQSMMSLPALKPELR